MPRFVGTLPGNMVPRTVELLLPAILLSHAPIPAKRKLEEAASRKSSQIRTERTKDQPTDVTCSLQRLKLRARKVHNLVANHNDDGTETIVFTEPRRFWLKSKEPGDWTELYEVEIMPERTVSIVIPYVSMRLG
jgi:hypothetical protein